MTNKPFKWQHQEILIDAPLYQKFSLSLVKEEEFANFVLSGGAVDAFCVECQQQSVFRIASTSSYNFEEEAKHLPKYGVITVKASCTRHANNYQDKCDSKIYCCLYRDGDELIKVGQFPSKADLDFASLDPAFSKELEASLRQDLGRAIGLRAHGVGVGSFVYLHRIFEALIEEAHNLSRSPDWDEATYSRSRMPERIKRLAAHLPSRLVQTAKLYDILSKGVHELSEEECLEHFDLVKTAVLMILKERHEERQYAALIKTLNATATQTKRKPA